MYFLDFPSLDVLDNNDGKIQFKEPIATFLNTALDELKFNEIPAEVIDVAHFVFANRHFSNSDLI